LYLELQIKILCFPHLLLNSLTLILYYYLSIPFLFLILDPSLSILCILILCPHFISSNFYWSLIVSCLLLICCDLSLIVYLQATLHNETYDINFYNNLCWYLSAQYNSHLFIQIWDKPCKVQHKNIMKRHNYITIKTEPKLFPFSKNKLNDR
jgi:hypothetical protein